MDPCCMIFEVYKAFERELRTFIVGEWAVLALVPKRKSIFYYDRKYR